MKIYLTILANLSIALFCYSQESPSPQPWEIKPKVMSESDKKVESDIRWMADVMRLHWNGERGLTEEEENRIFEIHDQAEGSNFLTTFSVIITIKDVGDWQDDFETLLSSKKSSEVTIALQTLNLILDNGTTREKIVLSNLEGLAEKLSKISEDFNGNPNIKSRIQRIDNRYEIYLGKEPPSPISRKYLAGNKKDTAVEKLVGSKQAPALDGKRNSPKHWLYWFLGALILGGLGVLVWNSRKGSSAS